MRRWGIEWPEGFQCDGSARYGDHFERVRVEWHSSMHEATLVVAKLKEKEWPRYDAKFIVRRRRVAEGGVGTDHSIARVRTPEEALAACLFYNGR